MLRFVIAGALTVIALVIVITAVIVDPNAHPSDLLFNLGAEVIGIALTVAIVDWLIERTKLREEAQRLAWRMLHEIDQAIWVWQGGRQEFHLDELAALLDMIGDDDHPIESTQDLFVNLGRTASDLLRLHPKILKQNPTLNESLKALTGLAQMRALKGRMPRTYVVDALRRAMNGLAEVTGQLIHTGTFGVAHTFRDGSREAQQERYQGWRFGGIIHRPDEAMGRPDPLESGHPRG